MAAAHDDDLSLARELADIADRITMPRYRAPDLYVDRKPDLTPVTEADLAVETALRDRLSARRPADAVIGEEFGGEASPGERRWIIDPIDGTKSYVRGMPTWATLIALADEDEVTVGVVSMPALGRRWWAARGRGAFAGGVPMRVSTISRLEDAQLLWSGVQEWDEVNGLEPLLGLARACWRTRGIGDAWQYMLVAEGAAEIAIDPQVSLWDLAAVSIVVEEAGGAFTDLSGVRTPAGGSAMASNGLVHEAALAMVGGRGR